MRDRYGVLTICIAALLLALALGVRAPAYADEPEQGPPLTEADFQDVDDPISDMVASVEEDELRNNVWNLQENFGYRTRFTPRALAARRAANHLADRFESLGLDAWIEQYWLWSTPPGLRPNVVAQIEGTAEPDTMYIICAHFDSTSEDPWNLAPGADDNASGVAAVLECARIMSNARYEFRHAIRFVCFSGEEQGLQGSKAYVTWHADEGVLGVYNLDMIGYVGRTYDYQLLWVDDESLSLALAAAAAIDTHVPDLPYALIGQEGGYSDHDSFADAGIAAICGTEDYYWEYEDCHTTRDLIGNLDFSLVRDCTCAALACMADLAGARYSGLGTGGDVSDVTSQRPLVRGSRP